MSVSGGAHGASYPVEILVADLTPIPSKTMKVHPGVYLLYTIDLDKFYGPSHADPRLLLVQAR